MATTERRVAQADRAVARLLPVAGGELREARLAAGISVERLASLVGCSRGLVTRIEQGQVRSGSVRNIAAIAAVVGLDLALRLYPAGPPVRDVAHVRLLERLRTLLNPALGWRTEVPLPAKGDRRAFDAVITGAGAAIAVEAETRIRDLQALQRRIALKCRDASVGRVVLLVMRSRTNRDALAGAGESFWAAYPIPTSRAVRALREGRDPGGSFVIVR